MPLGLMAAALKSDILMQGGVHSRNLSPPTPPQELAPLLLLHSHPQLLLLQQDMLRM